jgi:hypothetical protein
MGSAISLNLGSSGRTKPTRPLHGVPKSWPVCRASGSRLGCCVSPRTDVIYIAETSVTPQSILFTDYSVRNHGERPAVFRHGGIFQFSQSFSDRLTRQDNPHPQFLHIQFHYRNYLVVRPLFALAGKHGTLSLAPSERRPNNTNRRPGESVQY